MKYLRAALAVFFIVSISMPAYSATEIRLIGGPGALNNGDLALGSGYFDSPGGRRVYRINTTMIPFASDNTVKVDDLFVLAAGATDGAPYVLSGTWTIDSNATFMSRHWSGTGDFLRYDGTRGAAGDTGVTTAILKGDGAGGFSDAVEGTDYVVPSGNVATATALAANPADCTGSDFAIGIDADGDAVCDTPSGVGDMLKSVYDTGANSIVDSAEALSAQYIDWSQSSGPTSIANKPTLGTMSSQAASAVEITGGQITGPGIDNSAIDNSIIGGSVAAAGTFSLLTSEGLATVEGGMRLDDDQTLRYGAGDDYICQFVSATEQVVCSTALDGSTMTDTNPAWLFNFADGGVADDEQKLGGFADNGVLKWDVDEDGDSTQTGEVTAAGYNTSAADGYHYFNVMNTNGESFAETAGDTYWDNTTKLWQTYDGANWRYGQHDAIEFVIDGGGSVITTGEKGHIEIPFPCTIIAARVFADQSGSIVVDLWKDTYANFPPIDGDSITASAPPTLSTAQKSEDTTLTGWTTALAAGDIIAYNVDSVSTVIRVTVSLKVLK